MSANFFIELLGRRSMFPLWQFFAVGKKMSREEPGTSDFMLSDNLVHGFQTFTFGQKIYSKTQHNKPHKARCADRIRLSKEKQKGSIRQILSVQSNQSFLTCFYANKITVKLSFLCDKICRIPRIISTKAGGVEVFSLNF